MQKESEIVLELAKDFIQTMESSGEKWEKAFLRFNIDETQFGSGGSYITNGQVKILDVFDSDAFIDRMCDRFNKLYGLFKENKKPFCVVLLVIDSEFNFKVLYEYSNPTKWHITKIDSDGIPQGYDVNTELDSPAPVSKKWWKLW